MLHLAKYTAILQARFLLALSAVLLFPYVSAQTGNVDEEGAVRLVDRVDVNGYATGTLQVFVDGAWGGVCDARFDNRGAEVACRQLGYPSGMRRLQDFQADPEIGGPLRFTDPDSVRLHIILFDQHGCSHYSVNLSKNVPEAE